MAMKIRLARGGSKKRPFYSIVAADSRMPRDGRFIEKLGTYNPLLPKDSEDRVKMNVERIQHWIAQGAQPTDRIARMLEAAGLVNFQKNPGWRSIPLERLAYEQPDLIAAAFFDSKTDHPALWSAMRHPIARQQMEIQPTVMIQGAWTACGGWFLLDAIESLAKAIR